MSNYRWMSKPWAGEGTELMWETDFAAVNVGPVVLAKVLLSVHVLIGGRVLWV